MKWDTTMKQKRKNKILISVLKKVCGAYTPLVLKKSGNVLNLIRSIDEDDAVKLADVSYKKTAKEKEIFPLALNFGHEFKNKNSFYRVELRDNILYFVGTESEIINRIKDKIDALTTKDDIEKEDKTKKEIKVKNKGR